MKSKFLLPLIVFLSVITPSIVSAQNNSANNGNSSKKISFSFKLDSSASTSAGVFKKDGTLLRTLWSGVKYTSGNHIESWDGLDDQGKVVTDSFNLKVLTNNVSYNWDGAVIGNTSSVSSGSGKLRAGSQPNSIVAAGNWLYCAGLYNEASNSHWKMPLANPTTKAYADNFNNQAYPQVCNFVCADNNNIYWAGFDPGYGAAFKTFVVATQINTDADVTFTNGVPYQMPNARFWPSTIGMETTPYTKGLAGDRSSVTGMTAQKNGNFLFISRGEHDYNEIIVIDKRPNHGEVVLTITSIAHPTRMVATNDGYLWLVHDGGVLEKFAVNSTTGALTTTGIATSDNNLVRGLDISADANELAVCDANDQIVKFYNTTTGTRTRTLGTVGGYLTDPNVTSTKFYWRDSRNGGYDTWIAYMPDGSIRVGDIQNRRSLHFTANLTYIDQIAFVNSVYHAGIVEGSTDRLAVGFMEFKIDYSVPLTRSTGWKLDKNWQSGYTNSFNYDENFNQITQFPNGRTYATARGAINTVHTNEYEIVEFVGAGGVIVRETGIWIPARTNLQPNGDLIFCPEGGAPNIQSQYIKYALTGFDSLNNPKWDVGMVIAKTPTANAEGKDPIGQFTLVGDKLINFQSSAINNNDNQDFHLSCIKVGTESYLWKTARGTARGYGGQFPADGAFDNGNGVNLGGNGAGGGITTYGNNIFWNYHGEFWQQTQTNKWQHIEATTGLFVGQFGSVSRDRFGEESPDNGGDGNVLNGTFVMVNGQGYIYHAGESSGLHRWSVNNLSSIQIQTATFPASNTADVEEGIDLMEGINWGMTTLPNNYHGWTRTPTSDVGTETTDGVQTLIGRRSYDRFKHPDLLLRYSQGAPNSASFTRDLGTNTALTSWKLKAVVNLQNSNESQYLYKQYNFLSIMDDNNKEIARFDIHQDQISGVRLLGGDRDAVVSNTTGLLHYFPLNTQTDVNLYGMLIRYNNQLEISCAGGVLTYKYGPYSATANTVNNTANWHNPKYFKWSFGSQADYGSTIVSIQELSFINTTSIDNHFRSKTSGNYNAVATWEHSIDSTTWEAAKQIPTTAANSIVIQSGHTISVTDTATVANIIVNNGGVLNVMPNAAITVNDGEGDDIVIEAGGRMNIKSDTTGNGRIATSTGTIKGNVTVEHFIPARGNGGYRLLGPSVNTTTSIKSNWQEGVNNSNVNMITNPFHGCGTHITGSTNGANGFDASITGQASLFTYNQTTPTQTWSSIGNTDYSTFDAKKGCLIFIRGSRSINVNDVLVKSDNTILRATGSIISGTVNYKAMEGNGRNSLVTNPYASSIDWVMLQQSNSTKFENYYTFWDPNIGSQGGYVTVDATGTPSVRTSAATTEIQSGQAFLIKAKPGISSPDFTIQESHKSSGNNLSVFKTTGVAPQKLYASLYYRDINGNRILADGVLARFSDDYSRDVDGDDADDMSNFDENIAFARNKSTLSIESRPSVKTFDTLYIKLNNVKAQHYEWQFNASDFDSSMIMQAYLKDAFLKTETKISITQTTVIGFDVTSNPFSASADRFSIVFKNAETLPVKMLSVSAIQQKNDVLVTWKSASEINMDRFEVERSMNGQFFSYATKLLAKGNSNSINTYSWLDNNPEKGANYYRIRSVSLDGSVEYSNIVKIEMDKSAEPQMSIYPMPVKNETLNIKLSNLEKGMYNLKLLNLSGQTMQVQNIEYAGMLITQSFSLNNSIAPGIYQLQLCGKNKTITQQIIKL